MYYIIINHSNSNRIIMPNRLISGNGILEWYGNKLFRKILTFDTVTIINYHDVTTFNIYIYIYIYIYLVNL